MLLLLVRRSSYMLINLSRLVAHLSKYLVYQTVHFELNVSDYCRVQILLPLEPKCTFWTLSKCNMYFYILYFSQSWYIVIEFNINQILWKMIDLDGENRNVRNGFYTENSYQLSLLCSFSSWWYCPRYFFIDSTFTNYYRAQPQPKLQ